jgi:hypothetical protein
LRPSYGANELRFRVQFSFLASRPSSAPCSHSHILLAANHSALFCRLNFITRCSRQVQASFRHVPSASRLHRLAPEHQTRTTCTCMRDERRSRCVGSVWGATALHLQKWLDYACGTPDLSRHSHHLRIRRMYCLLRTWLDTAHALIRLRVRTRF